ncbi:MAG: CoA-binding protein [Phycisphaerales bacterium]|nr:CoA-binding protein [Phycisphaerales bacterium]
MKKRVVIVGASADPAKFGNKSVRAHLRQNWEVIPINPKGGQIEGLTVRKSLRDVTGPVERVSLYLPPDLGILELPNILALQPAEFFVNPGAESDELIEEARRIGLDPIIACSIVAIGERP